MIERIPNGTRVIIRETITGNGFGERGTVEGFDHASCEYKVRADDGSLFSRTPEGVEQINEKVRTKTDDRSREDRGLAPEAGAAGRTHETEGGKKEG